MVFGLSDAGAHLGQICDADQPVGVRHVLVNGVPIRTDGRQDLTIRSGQLVRSAPRKDV
jgi:hypothetical protein